MEEADRVWDEISSVDIQQMMDQMLGDQTFSFSEYVTSLMHGQLPVSVESIFRTIVDGLAANLAQEKKMYVYLVLIAVIGAMLSNFTSLLQGKQVAETAFYAVYMLFFSLLLTSFIQIAGIAGDTLTQLLDFMKVLSPSYFMTMAFSQGALSSGVYYQFTLIMITLVDFVLVKFALPAIHIYFLLRIANQLSKQDMFTKMSELIHDVVKFVMKTMFGIMMGLNVIQGLVVPITSQLESSAIIKLSGAIPGVGSTISSVTSTILLAGNLVKNSVGAVGIIAVLFYCGIPLLRLVVNRFGFQFIGALIQPVSDSRITACIAAVVESMKLLTYAVFVGCMMFVVSIALISAMTFVR
ncbi:MAG: hypothetical protein HFH73_11040 [Lachnospiraceae bacterium]|jgi:stage III sporulation protein AE|nr:hypothetical protein [Lachnospiraceae bacterium]